MAQPSPPDVSFPTCKPALWLRTSFPDKDRFDTGQIYTGSSLMSVPLPNDAGSVVSVGDFEPKCNFRIRNSIDYFQIDHDGSHGRTRAHGLLYDEQGRSVRMIIHGYIKLIDESAAIMQNDPNVKVSPFGHGMETFTFETGHPEYKALENMTFAGSLRFGKVDDNTTSVEVRIAHISSGTGYE